MNIQATDDASATVTITLDGNHSRITVGGGGSGHQYGKLLLLHPNGSTGVHLDSGTIRMSALGGGNAISMDPTGGIEAGGNGAVGQLWLNDASGMNTIHLDAAAGDIILANADCAEDFDLSDPDGIQPGAVVVIDDEGKLRRCKVAYDKRVAGVISGAGGYKPGITLDKRGRAHNRAPVSLVGKVYCQVDATYSPIEVGDLLTTSPTPGYAMRATDSIRAFGAVIGKALRPLKNDQGLIPILIALQ